MLRYFISILIVTLAFVSCENNSGTKPKYLSIQPGPENGKDAVISFYSPNVNWSTEEFIHGFSWTIFNAPVIGRSYLSFDIHMLQKSTTIDSAFLALTVIEHSNFNSTLFGVSGNNELVFQRIIEPWNEDSITWFNTPAITDVNEVYTPKLDSNCVNTTLIVDVTKMLNDALEEKEQEFGVSFKLINEEPYSIALFASSEHDSVAYRPKLEIYYKESK